MRTRQMSIILLLVIFAGCAPTIRQFPSSDRQKLADITADAHQRIEKCLSENMSSDFSGPVPRGSSIDTIIIDPEALVMQVHFRKPFSFQP